MKIKNFKIATKTTPKTKQAFIFKHLNTDFAIIKEQRFYNISHFATGVNVKSTIETTEEGAKEYFLEFCNTDFIERIESALKQNNYPILNKIEEVKEKKPVTPRIKPTFLINDGLTIKLAEFCKTFEYDCEKYVVTKIKSYGFEIYHFETGRCASSFDENTIIATIEKFKNRFDSFREDNKNRYRNNLKNHLKINNL